MNVKHTSEKEEERKHLEGLRIEMWRKRKEKKAKEDD